MKAFGKIVMKGMALGISMFLLSGCLGGGDPSPVPPTPQPSTKAPTARTLSITPVAQETTEWCWAASAQMVLSYYGLPDLNPSGNYQCGIVGAFYGYIYPQYPQCFDDCSQCAQLPGGTMDHIQTLIDQYGQVANQVGVSSRVLTSTLLFMALSPDEVASEINAGRPIIAGISPGSFSFPDISQHAVVIVGYDDSGAAPALIVNDPFPYDEFAPQPNPYTLVGGTELQPGRYSIDYQQFVSAINWGNTLYQIH
jgi:hypothetical protein